MAYHRSTIAKQSLRQNSLLLLACFQPELIQLWNWVMCEIQTIQEEELIDETICPVM